MEPFRWQSGRDLSGTRKVSFCAGCQLRPAEAVAEQGSPSPLCTAEKVTAPIQACALRAGSLRLDPLTKTAGIYLCAFGIALSDSAIAAQPRLVDEELVAAGKIDIRPEYPVEAQAQRLTGTGVFVLHVDPKNGQVSSIDIEKSTGH